MCCSLDLAVGKFILKEISLEDDASKVHVKGIYDHAPKTLTERFTRYFQRIEALEKIAEIVDESFHLFQPIFQRHTNPMVYQTLHDLHHSAHCIEHILHSFCFLGDLVKISSGKFFKDQEGNSLSYLRCASRICHVTAHCFATVEFLNHLKLTSLNQFEKNFKYKHLMSTVGFALWTVSLFWQRYQGEVNDQFDDDMNIHLGGCLFEASHFLDEMEILSPTLGFIVGKVGALAGVIHAWSVVQRLKQKDSEEIEFDIPKVKFPQGEQELSHTAFSEECKGITCHPLNGLKICAPCPSPKKGKKKPKIV